MTGIEWVALFGIGLVAGLAGGLLGVGGSVVMIPAMTVVLGPNQHLYQAAAMIVNFFVVVPAVIQHRRARAIDRHTVRQLLPLAILAVIIGVLISESWVFAGPREAYLRALFGLFLLAMGSVELVRMLRPRRAAAGEGEGTPGWGRAAIAAVPTGLVAGLLGVGGGILAVPLQRRFLGIPIRNAIANSATIIIATSLVGAALKNYAYVTDHDGDIKSFLLAAILIPTAVIGSMIGSRLTHRLPVSVVKAAFLVLLAIAGARLTIGGLGSAPKPGPAASLAPAP